MRKHIKLGLTALLVGAALTSCVGTEKATDSTKEITESTASESTGKTSEPASSATSETSVPVTEYTITICDGNTTIATVTVKSGEALAYTAPEKEGYVFDGIYTDKDLTTKYNGGVITADTSLYLGYTKAAVSYQVSIYDGTTLVTTVTVAEGKSLSYTAPEKEGYTFNGIYTDSGLTKKYDNSVITSDASFYLGYTKNAVTYLVNFYVNGELYKSVTVDENTTVNKPSDPEVSGYTFEGWYTDAACTDGNEFLFTKKITAVTNLYAKFSEEVITKESITLRDYAGYTEGAYAEFDYLSSSLTTSSDYKVYYKLSSASTYTELTDTTLNKAKSNLLRNMGSYMRVDLVGLTAGTYDIKITDANDAYPVEKEITVTEDDRSGYAHFGNTTGIGAYDNTGALKSNAVVVYVTDDNKNTVTASYNGKTYTGLANIIKAATSKTIPLDIRIIGSVNAQQWSSKTHGAGSTAARMTSLDNAFASVDWTTTSASQTASSSYYKIGEEDIISYGINTLSTTGVKYDANGNTTTITGITHLDGLTNVINKDKSASSSGYCEYDSYYNEMDVRGCYNITVEGIGEDAGIFQWGFCFNQCNSIEVKNIEFSSYTEDAIGIQGGSSSNMDYSGFWIHDCTFNKGVNNWDVCYENDKTDGDGSTDFKYAHNLTISYCQYNRTHKTALIGSSYSSYQYNVTFHHNYYNTCGSRLPFTRQTNMHIYNCYYYKSTGTNMQINCNAYALIEGCNFNGTNKTFTTSNESKSSVNSGVIKLWNNTINSTSSVSASDTVVYASTRDEAVTNYCAVPSSSNYNAGTSYSSFDTDSTLFYYDSANKCSKVDIMNSSDKVSEIVPTVAGAGKCVSIRTLTDENDSSVKYTLTFNANGGSCTTSTMSVTEGKTASLPTPTYEGYDFAGWYTDTNYTTQVTSSTAITKDMTLYAKWTKSTWYTIVNDDFSTAVTATKTDAVPTASGLYYQIAAKQTDASSTSDSTNYVSVSNGVLNIHDESSTTTTWGYYMFSEVTTSGKVKISMDFTPGKASGSWSAITFLAKNGKNIALRTDSNKYLSYSLDGSTCTNILTTALVAKTTYSILFTIDFDNSTATIAVNDTTVTVSGWTLSGITGIQFMTAVSDTARSFTIDNLKVLATVKE